MALKRGARSFQLKPLENDSLKELFEDIISFNKKESKKVLVVEDNETDSSQIIKMLHNGNLEVTLADTERKQWSRTIFSLTIVLFWTTAFLIFQEQILLKKVSETKKKLTPVIVYSAKDFNRKELVNLNRIQIQFF